MVVTNSGIVILTTESQSRKAVCKKSLSQTPGLIHWMKSFPLDWLGGGPLHPLVLQLKKLRFWSKRSESLLIQSTALQEVSRHLLKLHHSGAAYCKDCCAPSDRHNASFHGAIAFNSRMVSVAVTSTVRSAPSKVFTFTNRGPWRNRSSLWRWSAFMDLLSSY